MVLLDDKDNTCPHTTNQTQDLLTYFGWEQFDHPLLNPNLALSDYRTYPAFEEAFAW